LAQGPAEQCRSKTTLFKRWWGQIHSMNQTSATGERQAQRLHAKKKPVKSVSLGGSQVARAPRSRKSTADTQQETGSDSEQRTAGQQHQTQVH